MYLDFFFKQSTIKESSYLFVLFSFTSWLLKAQIEYRAETKQ